MNRIVVTSLLLALSATASAVPLSLSHQGRLIDALGAPLDGSHDVAVHLFDAPSSGNDLWTDTFTVTFDNGFYSLQMGSGVPLAYSVFDDNDDLWLEIAVDSGPPVPLRLPLNSVPFALRAHSVMGGVVDATEIQINGTTVIDGSGTVLAASSADSDTLLTLSCGANEVAGWNGSNWNCQVVDAPHSHDAVDLSTGVLDVNRLPVGGSASDVAAGDHVHALAALTGQITPSQLPGTMVDAYVVDGPLDFDGGSTLGGAAISTGTHYGDAAADARIGIHEAVADAHHTEFNDAAAVSAVAAADDYVSNTGDVVGGALWLDNGHAGRNLAAEVGTIDSESACFNAGRCSANLLDGIKNLENGGRDWLTPSGQRDGAWVIVDLGATYAVDRAVVYNQNEYDNSRREVKDFTLEWSADKSAWTSMAGQMGFSDGREPNPGWSFRLPPNTPDAEGVSARYFRFTMRTFHATDGYGGIMELELYEARNAVRGELTSATLTTGNVYAQSVSARNLTAMTASATSYTWSQLNTAADGACPSGYHVGVAMEVLVRCYMDSAACRRMGGDVWVAGNHDVAGCSRNLLSHSGTDCWGGENTTVDNVPTTLPGYHWVMHAPSSYAGSRGPSLGARADSSSYPVACVPNWNTY